MRKEDMRLRIAGSRDRIVTKKNELRIKATLLNKYSSDTIIECYDYKKDLMATMTLDTLYGEKEKA